MQSKHSTICPREIVGISIVPVAELSFDIRIGTWNESRITRRTKRNARMQASMMGYIELGGKDVMNLHWYLYF